MFTQRSQRANTARQLWCLLIDNPQMSDDLVKQLSNYKAQLQQVEVALSTDPDNEDLLKLQKDLQVCAAEWISFHACYEESRGKPQ